MKNEFAYAVSVEWDTLDGFGFDVFLSNDINWLAERLAKAKKTEFDTQIGSCPNLSVIKCEFHKSNITKRFLKLMGGQP